MDYNKRIDDNFLKAEYVDGEVLQHTDMNELESVVKLGVNANYEDIQKIQDGTISVENSNKLSGATLSKVSSEALQNSDNKVPTSAQVKQYIDSAISSIDLTGYASEIFVENEIADTVEIYDSNGNGIVDNAEKVNNHTVDKDVPSDAKFTDTIYDDTEVRGLISDLDDDKVDKVTGKGLSTNDYTTTEKNKLAGIANNAQVNVLEKVSVNGTQQTISNKSVNISVPTQLSQLSADSTHRLVTDTEKTTWNNKADISDIPSLTNYVKFTDYATAQKGGVVRANMAGFNISSSGIPSANVYNYPNYLNAGDGSFLGKGTLENVIAGKNLETADNKVTEITENSTDTEYPSAKAVYGFTNNISEELKEEDEYLNSVIEQLPRDEATGTSVTLQPTIQAKMKMSLAPSELEQTTYTGKNLWGGFSYSTTSNGIQFTYNTDGSVIANGTATGTATSMSASVAQSNNFLITLQAGTYTMQGAYDSNKFIRICDEDGTTIKNSSITSGDSFTITETKQAYIIVRISQGQTCNNQKFSIQLESGSTATAYEPYVGGTTSPNPEYPQDIHTISGSNSMVIGNKNLAHDIIYFTQTDRFATTVRVSYNVVQDQYYAISFDTPNTNIRCYIDYTTASKLERVGDFPTFTCDGTRKTFIVKGLDNSTTSNINIIKRYDETSTTATGLLSNFMIEPIASASDTSTSYEPYVSQEAPINLPVENLFDKDTCTDSAWLIEDGSVTSPHTGYSVSDFIPVLPNTSYYRTKTGSTRAKYYDKNKQPLNTTSYQDISILGNAGTFTTPSNCYYIRMTINTSTTDLNTIQLEKGTKANSFTPYGTTPIEYCKIGNYKDEFIRTSGKNILPSTLTTQTLNGVQVTRNSDGSITLNGTTTANTDFKWFEGNLELKAGTYYVGLVSTYNFNLYTLDSNGTTVIQNPVSKPYTELTLSSDTTITRLSSYLGANKTFNNITFYPMITKTLPFAYEPYGTNQWYLKKNIGKVVLDGSESSWKVIDLSNAPDYKEIYTMSYDNQILWNTRNGFVDRFSNYNNVITPTSNITSECFSLGGDNAGAQGRIRFAVLKTTASTINEWKTWLSTHNTIVYYPLATPTYTQITGTLETQLNNIYKNMLSYKGTTNVSQINNDLPFVLGVSAIKDINAMISELTNAIIELGGE